MRHRKKGRHLGSHLGHRKALEKNLINQLFTHERILTTKAKAKELRPKAEKIITMAKKAFLAEKNAKTKEEKEKARLLKLHYIREVISRIGKKKLYDKEGEPILTPQDRIRTVIQKLFEDLGERYADRPGGYTRILKLPMRRQGDDAQLVLWELVGKENLEVKPKKTKTKKKTTKE